MSFIKKQRPAAPWSDHNWWGQYDGPMSMPNTPASDIQVSSTELQRGDIAWSESDAKLYYCDVPTAGAAVWLPINTGGGGGGVDHFAPKIIVGNATAGDPAAPQGFPFRYISDPGDGSGIAQALTEAAVAGQGGDVYLRPGVYDFGLPSSPSLPLVVPSNVQLRGGGGSAPAPIGGTPTRGVTMVLSGSNRSLFQMEPISGLSNISVQISTPSPGATGTEVILGIGPVPDSVVNFIDRCTFFVTASQADAVNESLTAIVRGQFIAVTESIFGRIDTPYQPGTAGATDLAGIEGANLNFSSSQVIGLDVGLAFTGDASKVVSANIANVRVGMDMSAGIDPTLCSDVQIQASDIGISMTGGGNVQMSNVQLFGAGNPGSIAVELAEGFLELSNVISFSYEQFANVTSGGQLSLDEAVVRGFVNTPGVPAIFVSSFLPIIRGCFIDGYDIGIELGAGCERAKLQSIDIKAESIGIVQREGVTETQIDNCRVEGLDVGTGLLLEPGGSDTTVRGLHARRWEIGVDYGSDFLILLGANLRTIPSPIVVTGTPLSPEIAHIQT